MQPSTVSLSWLPGERSLLVGVKNNSARTAFGLHGISGSALKILFWLFCTILRILTHFVRVFPDKAPQN